MGKNLLTAMLAVVAVALTAGPAGAALIFTATLTGSQEVPPNASTATGFATFVLDGNPLALTYNVTIFGLDFTGMQTPAIASDNLVAAHIHAAAPAGVTAGVVFGFFPPPFNDNNPADVVVTPFMSGVGGTITGKWDLNEGAGAARLSNQLPNILAGLAYINFHTSGRQGGEIRGQILALPEPATWAVFGLGVVGLVGYRCRRRCA